MPKGKISRILILTFLLGGLLLAGCSLKTRTASSILSPEQAKAKAEKFINDNLMRGRGQATITKIDEDEGLYRLTVDIGQKKPVISYLTKDGKKFFAQAMDIADVEKQAQAQKDQQKQKQNEDKAKITPQQKPDVELFVMSYCPYGTQMEKGILPVVDLLGDKINFQVKFCDYAMHGEKEVKENLRQYCIQKEEPEKYIKYLKCFLKAGKADECLVDAKINQTKLKSCSAKTDKKYNVTKNLEDKDSWRSGRFPVFAVNQKDDQKYAITGSPGLVINGVKVRSDRDPKSLLDMVCAGFKDKPAECNQELSAEAPAPGFGFGQTSQNSSGGCGN